MERCEGCFIPRTVFIFGSYFRGYNIKNGGLDALTFIHSTVKIDG